MVGYVYDVEQQNPAQNSITPELLQVSAYVDFFPGDQAGPFPAGFAALVSDLNHLDGTSGDTEVPLAPITARLMNGVLSTVAVGDPPGVELLADTPILNLANPLFYHTRWRDVTFGGGQQVISNFAWQATTATPVGGLTATPNASSGGLSAGTYWYGVTAKVAGVETIVSAAVSATTTGTTGSVTLNWSAFPSATSYNIYRGSSATTLTALVGSSTSLAFNDTGYAGSAVAAPSTDVVDLTSPNLPRYQYAGPA